MRQKNFHKHKFFFKMMLSYCLILFLGLGLVSLFVSLQLTTVLTEMESRIDYEVLGKVKNYSDENFKTVEDIFTRLYMQLSYNNNTSVVDCINPNKQYRLDASSKNGIISSYLQDTCSANAFIADIFIVDYSGRQVYFFSSIAGRDVSLDYDFYRPDFIGDTEVNNKIRILPNHIPDYINAPSVNDTPVISYCLYLFDENFIRFENPLGMIVVNVRADHFKAAYRDAGNFNGTIFVMDQNNIVLFDSSGAATGTAFPFSHYDAADLNELSAKSNLIVNTMSSADTGFTYLDLVDKGVVEKKVGAIRNSIYGIIGVCLAVTLLVGILFASMFSKRIRTLVDSMKKVENGNFASRISVRSSDEIGYLEYSFNNMCEKLDEYIQSVYVFQLQTKTAELKALQAQISPHFLFNTLESIRMTAQINKDPQTAKMIHLLGNIFRWNIKKKGMFVDLREEIEYIHAYVNLQLLRYDNAFSLSVEIPPSLLPLGVPKLLLQPLVENALSHGLCNCLQGSRIFVEAKAENGVLLLSVEDDGAGLDASRLREVIDSLERQEPEDEGVMHIGLNNIHQRVRLLFGNAYGLSLTSEPGQGTKVTVSLPALKKEEMEAYVQSFACR